MKKHGLFLFVALLISVSTNAQLFEYGLKAGVNFGTLPIEDITGIRTPTGAYDLVTGESVRGYEFGLMTRLNIAMLFVQPELYFNAVGGSVQKVVEGGATELLDVKFNRVDLPVLVGAKLGPLRLNVGPVASAVVGSTTELIEISQDLDNISNSVTFGYQAGVGLDLLGRLAVDFRYEGSLSEYQKDFTIPDVGTFDFDSRPQAWILSFGWWF